MIKKITLVTILFFIMLYSGFAQAGTVSSLDINSSQKRVKELKKYLNLRGNTLDAEFYIIDSNIGGSRLPGATYRNYKVALKLDSESYILWLEDMQLSTKIVNYNWIKDIPVHFNNLNIDSKAAIYETIGKTIIAFEDEKIIFINIVQE